MRTHDGPGGRKAGQIIDMRPGGFKWPRGMLNSTWHTILVIEGKTCEDLKEYKKRHVIVTDPVTKKKYDVRSKYLIDMNAVPLAIKTKMTNELYQKINITYSEWESTIKNTLVDDEEATIEVGHSLHDSVDSIAAGVWNAAHRGVRGFRLSANHHPRRSPWRQLVCLGH